MPWSSQPQRPKYTPVVPPVSYRPAEPNFDDPSSSAYVGEGEQIPLLDETIHTFLPSEVREGLPPPPDPSPQRLRYVQENFPIGIEASGYEQSFGSDSSSIIRRNGRSIGATVTGAIANTMIPWPDLREARGPVVRRDNSNPRNYQSRGSYRPHDQVVELASDAGLPTLVHELGHRLHLAENDRQGMQAQRAAGDPDSSRSGASSYLEGVAEGYRERYGAMRPGYGSYTPADWGLPEEQTLHAVTRDYVATSGRMPPAQLLEQSKPKNAAEGPDSRADREGWQRIMYRNALHTMVQAHPGFVERLRAGQVHTVPSEQVRNIERDIEVAALQHQAQESYWEQPSLLVEHLDQQNQPTGRYSASPEAGSPQVESSDEHLGSLTRNSFGLLRDLKEGLPPPIRNHRDGVIVTRGRREAWERLHP